MAGFPLLFVHGVIERVRKKAGMIIIAHGSCITVGEINAVESWLTGKNDIPLQSKKGVGNFPVHFGFVENHHYSFVITIILTNTAFHASIRIQLVASVFVERQT